VRPARGSEALDATQAIEFIAQTAK